MDNSGNIKNTINLNDKDKRFFRCSSCILSDELSPLYEGFEQSPPISDVCDKTQDVYVASNKFGIDGSIARTFALVSSGDPCYVDSNSGGLLKSTLSKYYSSANCGVLSNANTAGVGVFNFSYAPTSNYNPFELDDSVLKFKTEFKTSLGRARSIVENSNNRGKIGLMFDDKYDYNLRNYYVLFTIADLSGFDGQELIDIYTKINQSNSECSNLDGLSEKLCCTKETHKNEDGDEVTEDVYTDKYGVCDTSYSFNEFVSALGSIDLNKAKGILGDNFVKFIENVGNYKYIYNTCNDCYDSSWKDNMCDSIEKYTGNKPPNCP